VNGTTFRRTSTQSRDNLNSTPAGPYIPPHLNQQASISRNGTSTGGRYSKDDFLTVYSRQKDAGLIGANLNSCYAGPWDVSGGADSSGGRPDSRDAGPEVCWNSQPDSIPLALTEMDDHERQVRSADRLQGLLTNKSSQLFSTSVNSPLKMNNPKEGSATVTSRKTSLSQVNTAGASRPGTRRRETSDSFANGPLSPVENKSFRVDPVTNTPPPPALLRRRTDYQDEPQEKDEGQPARTHDSPFASLRRTGTGGPPSAGLNPSSASPWSSGPSSAFGSMGAFGSMAADSSTADPGSAQRPGFGSARGASRFKDILGKGNEDMSPSVKEKASFTGLEQLPEEDDLSAKIRETLKTRPNRSETNPYDDLMPRTGSAALSAQDEPGVEQMGFSAFSNQTPHKFNQDPTSPTNTNPYHSPYVGRMPEDEGPDPQPGMQPFGRRDVFAGTDHRAQNSFGSLRGTNSGMAGLGGIPGWDNPSFSAAGTPGRDRPPVSAAFGDSVFSPLGGLQSPSAFGGGAFFGAGSSFGRGANQSRLGLPFPPAMQDQMRSESRNDAFGARPDPFEPRRQDSFRAFDDVKLPGEDVFGLPPNRSPVGVARQSSSNSPTGSNTGSASQIPTTQQRQMVMPDRMRWVYRDPLGNVQGPWSGLEMHDWFKAGFFTAELQVKKQEDTEYEPLAQLVRRIGNSREPFLVPQIGVPHGPPPPANAASPWSPSGPPSSAQPPFASSFPSFGTTLTADQQNALERRKQEEQFLMAQQKEWLAQKQVGMRAPNAPYGPHMHSLQHHSSAQSLHSQPSFGSITSPTGFQQGSMPPIQPPPSQGSAYQSMTPTAAMPPRDDDLPGQFGRMGLTSRSPYGSNPLNQQSFAAHERNRLSMENQQAQQYAHEQTFLGQPGRNDRLEEFHELRQDMDEDELEEEESLPQPIGSQRPTEDVPATQQSAPIGRSKKIAEDEPLSLTQQVQRTAAANKQAAEDTPIVEPPRVSITPLPAPAAQRSRPPVAEQLAAESRSAVQTPVETPGASLAPWADKTAEIPKGPSLKEIQEMEAKNAAKQEAINLEARRLQMEQERHAAAQAPAPAPGLPLTSTWASSGSPSTPTTPGGSAWTKPVTVKPTTAAAKKTLAQIQKEEEARKQRADAQAAAIARTASYTSAAPTGNRYAQMAGKVTAPQQTGPTPVGAQSQSPAGGAWQTVGASGKPKTPATVVAAAPAQRTVSSTIAARPALTSTGSRSASMAVSAGPKDKAKEELNKWAKAQLSGKLNSGMNVDNFVGSIVDFPPDIELLAEAVYGSSETLDGRRFAEEFIRRRRLADKGIIEDNKAVPASENKSGNGGWSEVAKKGPATAPKEDATAAGFKVVSKKPKKR